MLPALFILLCKRIFSGVMYRYRYRRRPAVPAGKLLILGASIVALLVIVLHFTGLGSETSITQTTTTTTVTLPEYIIPTAESPKAKQSSSIKMPAVDDNGNGVVTNLRVDIMPGDGRTLVNINYLLFWVDTQYSIQSARLVAQNVTGMDLSKTDIVYTIETNASLIEGPSAGAALTIATVAALQNKTLNESVMITGTISRGGLVGPVGSVLEKAIAAKEIGATLFIVPSGQAVQTYYEPQRDCRQIGPVSYCTTSYVERTIDIAKEAGMDVKSVTTIQEALGYFILD
jgi:uncharacterized protein